MFVQPLFFALKGIPLVKYEKKLSIMPSSVLFSQHWVFGPDFAQRQRPI